MVATVITLLLFGFGIPAFIGWLCWQLYLKHKAKSWPSTEATVQSGDTEVVHSSEYGAIRLPCFAFTYIVDGDRQSGYFSLRPYTTDPGEGLIQRMVNRKLQILYNPAKPEEWYIPTDLIEGCKVEQKMGPHIFGLYPKD
jgi:hypothetical protein